MKKKDLKLAALALLALISPAALTFATIWALNCASLPF